MSSQSTKDAISNPSRMPSTERLLTVSTKIGRSFVLGWSRVPEFILLMELRSLETISLVYYHCCGYGYDCCLLMTLWALEDSVLNISVISSISLGPHLFCVISFIYMHWAVCKNCWPPATFLPTNLSYICDLVRLYSFVVWFILLSCHHTSKSKGKYLLSPVPKLRSRFKLV